MARWAVLTPERIQAAFEALAAGDSLLAEATFEREVESSDRLIAGLSQLLASELRRKAEAARNVASLAVVRGDLSKGVRYFEIALEAVPGDLDAAMQLGYAWIALGSLEKASETFGGVITRARELQEERFEAWGNNGQGDVLVAQGDGPGALGAYQASLEVPVQGLDMGCACLRDATRSACGGSEGLKWGFLGPRRWVLSYLQTSASGADPLQRNGSQVHPAPWVRLEIAAALAKRDPANTQWQRDLSVSHNKIGDGLVAQGNGPGALGAYQEGLEIREGLVKRDPANTEWQVDVAESCEKMGSLDSLLSINDRRECLQRGRQILSKLKDAGRLQANQDWIGAFDQALEALQ